ncbi:class I SAM-dependent methyltransferase [Uliginosibacterium sp. sgz301328]|uniref:class I SAM-dependent DNA methyltransferase n=1 Tax=Uliginosibacterium sp. sgz301328 TaxID=3243764 RepID=UPI00359E07E8
MNTRHEHFSSLYRASADPWQVCTRWYERRKRAALLAMLPRAQFRRAFEPACGNGELTLELARRCDRVIAGDLTADAVAIARQRTGHLSNVEIDVREVPSDWPEGNFDLIVLSEFLYYVAIEKLPGLVHQATGSLSEQGVIVACHWRPDSADRSATTEQIHSLFDVCESLHKLARHEERDFLLEMWSPDGRSVMEREARE